MREKVLKLDGFKSELKKAKDELTKEFLNFQYKHVSIPFKTIEDIHKIILDMVSKEFLTLTDVSKLTVDSIMVRLNVIPHKSSERPDVFVIEDNTLNFPYKIMCRDKKSVTTKIVSLLRKVVVVITIETAIKSLEGVMSNTSKNVVKIEDHVKYDGVMNESIKIKEPTETTLSCESYDEFLGQCFKDVRRASVDRLVNEVKLQNMSEYKFFEDSKAKLLHDLVVSSVKREISIWICDYFRNNGKVIDIPPRKVTIVKVKFNNPDTWVSSESFRIKNDDETLTPEGLTIRTLNIRNEVGGFTVVPNRLVMYSFSEVEIYRIYEELKNID